MKGIKIFCRSTVACVFILFSVLMLPSIALSQEGEDKTVETDPTLDAVLKVLVESFDEYNKAEKLSFWKLKEASVNLNTVSEKTVGGGFKFFIFSLGTKRTVQDSSTIGIKLSVKDDGNKNNKLKSADLKSRIAQAIQLAQTSVSKLNTGGLSSEMTYELKFTVGWKTEGGVEVPDLIPIEFSAKGEIAKTKIHSLKLVFK